MRAVSELDLGQADKSLDDLKLMLRLVDSIRNEPFFDSMIFRRVMLKYAIQPIMEGLIKHRWSDAALLQIDQELRKLDLLSDLQAASRAQRASVLATIDYSRRQRDYREYAGYPPDGFEWDYQTVLGAIGFHLIPTGWFYQVELGFAKTNQQWTLRMVDTENHLAFPQHEIRLPWVGFIVRPWWLFLANGTYYQPEYPERRIIYLQESVDLARVACNLERHRLALGEYPATLAALSPRFMETIPHDIIGGQPLHYHRTADGNFLLYSVGWNEKDDGGEPMKNDRDGGMDFATGDCVWPSQPK